MRALGPLWLLAAFLPPGLFAHAAVYYVSPNGRAAQKGTAASPWTLAKANRHVRPGDSVVLQDGTYRKQVIQPARSGVKGHRIIYRAAHPRKAVFTQTDIPILLDDRSYLTLDGIQVKDGVRKFLVGSRCHHLTITNCHFENATGAKATWLRDTGDGCRITKNFFKGGGDLLWIGSGSGHLIEHNVFDTARHTCLVVLGIQRSVVRFNRLRNPLQKLMEVFIMAPEFTKVKAIQGREPRQLLIEHNFFELSRPGMPGTNGHSGLQFAGANQVILRRNVFQTCGIGLDWGTYNHGEARKNRSNRVYHNVFYKCGAPITRFASGPGILFHHSGPGDAFGGHVLANNIFFKNRIYPGERQGYTPPGTPVSCQIIFGRRKSGPKDVRLLYNNVLYQKPGATVIYHQAPKKGYTLKQYEQAFPKLARGNIEADPLFTDPEKGDYTLKPQSPMIDAGGALTRTRKAGRGIQVPVRDALYFCDGFGLIDPDMIRIGSERVKVLKVDYEGQRITISRKITWKAGAPVSLDYEGSAPDIGAFESKFARKAE